MDYEAEKIDIERKKLALEEAKLASETKRTKWTAISVVVPLLAAMGTVAFGFWSTKEQSKIQFRLEAAKAIMSAGAPFEAIDRLRLFRALFPKEVPWAAEQVTAPDSYEIKSKLDLFRAMSAREMTPEKILDLWIALFPEDEWPKRTEVRATVVKGSN